MENRTSGSMGKLEGRNRIMNVFDLALDLNDKEWFMRLHKIINKMNNERITEMTAIREGKEYTYRIDWSSRK